jgi:hypothetical protein
MNTLSEAQSLAFLPALTLLVQSRQTVVIQGKPGGKTRNLAHRVKLAVKFFQTHPEQYPEVSRVAHAVRVTKSKPDTGKVSIDIYGYVDGIRLRTNCYAFAPLLSPEPLPVLPEVPREESLPVP